MTAPWLIVAGDFTRTGGMDKANYHLAWHLANQRGEEVHLAAHRVAEPLADHPNVRVHRVARPFGRHILGGVLLNRAGRGLARQLSAAHPRTRVIVNGGNCSWPGSINWAHMVHAGSPSPGPAAPLLYRARHSMVQAWHCRGERRALAASSLVLANSLRTRNELVERVGVAPERIQVVYLGCDGAENRVVTPEERAEARRHWQVEKPYVLTFIGALGRDGRKGFDTLLGACVRLMELGRSDFTVLAAGSGDLPYWQHQIDARRLGAHVRLIGHTSAVASLLAATDLLVSPTRFEPYGLAVHEAICRGVPALVSTAAGIAERFPPELAGLLLADPNDGQELARRIVYWQEQGKQHQEHVERLGAEWRAWTWNHMAARMAALIEESASWSITRPSLTPSPSAC